MERREFLQRAGLSIGAATATGFMPRLAMGEESPPATKPVELNDWKRIRAQFPLAPDKIHLTTFFLSSHPHSVAAAIERHRKGFDNDPVGYFHEYLREGEPRCRAVAAEYMGVEPEEIALTDSTTMGLGLIYGALDLKPDQEIVSTTHDHYSTQVALQHRAQRTGAKVREISLYDDPAKASVDEILARTRKAITDRTRVLAVTWVHSCTGVKLPIAAMARVVSEVNKNRDEADRVLFCVDGVHGFGVENVTMSDLGCDFFIAGTHKWIFAPRGTGLVWGRPSAWKSVHPVIPSFGLNYEAWMGYMDRSEVPIGDLMTPGGFHSFEYRWAVAEAFQFHQQIGKARVEKRIHELNTLAKTALAKLPHVTLHTPITPELSSGIICFEVKGVGGEDVVQRLAAKGIIASTSPYRVSYPRIAPSLINNEEEIERTLSEIRAMA